jgi:hypothetical protein
MPSSVDAGWEVRPLASCAAVRPAQPRLTRSGGLALERSADAVGSAAGMMMQVRRPRALAFARARAARFRAGTRVGPSVPACLEFSCMRGMCALVHGGGARSTNALATAWPCPLRHAPRSAPHPVPPLSCRRYILCVLSSAARSPTRCGSRRGSYAFSCSASTKPTVGRSQAHATRPRRSQLRACRLH